MTEFKIRSIGNHTHLSDNNCTTNSQTIAQGNCLVQFDCYVYLNCMEISVIVY